MANVTQISLLLASGNVVNFVVDENAITLSSPTMPGDHKVILNAPKAPTPAEIAANPAAHDGDSFDPTLDATGTTWFDANGDYHNLGIYGTFAAFFREERALALEWFKWKHRGAELNLNALSAGQRQRLGLT